MPQRSMRQFPVNQQMSQSGNSNTFSETVNNSNSNNPLIVASPMNQIPPQSHQGPQQHRGMLHCAMQNLFFFSHLHY